MAIQCRWQATAHDQRLGLIARTIPHNPQPSLATEYDMASGAWHVCPCTGDVPSPRVAHTAAALGGKLYIFGGRWGVRTEHVQQRLSRARGLQRIRQQPDASMAFTPSRVRPGARRSGLAMGEGAMGDMYVYDPASESDPARAAPHSRSRPLLWRVGAAAAGKACAAGVML